MANEFDAADAQNWAKERGKKKGAGAVGGAAAAGADDEDAAVDDEDAAADGPMSLGDQLRAVAGAIGDGLDVLKDNALPAADAKKFRKRLDKVIEDMGETADELTEFADDYDKAHADDEKPGDRADDEEPDDDEDDEDEDAGSED